MKTNTKVLLPLFLLTLLMGCGGKESGDNKNNNNGSGGVTDTVSPVITLKGKDPIVIELGDTFKEPGATAIDDVDGEVQVEITGTVDNKTLGAYPLTYKAKDKTGNISEKIRHVIVDPVTVVHQVSTVTELRNALNAAQFNHASDIIILQKGVYKTTADSQNTFRYSDTEKYNLTIKSASGLKREDVVLDGDSQDLVLSYQSSSSIQKSYYTTLTLDSLTIKNGKNTKTTKGAGVYTSHKLHLINSHIINNINVTGNSIGGGIYAHKSAIIENSLINNNKAYSRAGIGVIGSAHIVNSTISGNESKWVAGGIGAGNLFIKNSTVSHNKANQVGGMSGRLETYCENTTVSYNQSNAMAAMTGGARSILKNCIFRGNKNNLPNSSVVQLSLSFIVGSLFVDNKGGLITSSVTTMINNTLINNDSTSTLAGKIINNVFDTGIKFSGNSTLYNNYIDTHSFIDHDKGGRVVILRNNIQPSDGLLNLDENLVPTPDSVLINNGLNMQNKSFKELFPDNEYLFKSSSYSKSYKAIIDSLQKDYQGKNRIVGGTIDIGANEKQ